MKNDDTGNLSRTRRNILKFAGTGIAATMLAGCNDLADRNNADESNPLRREVQDFQISPEATSLRGLSRRMDSEKPSKRLLGNGAPHDTRRLHPEDIADADQRRSEMKSLARKLTMYNGEEYIREEQYVAAYKHAYDLGMINRNEKGVEVSDYSRKGLVESHRWIDPADEPLETRRQAQSSDEEQSNSEEDGTVGGYSLRSIVDRHVDGTTHKCIWYNTKTNPGSKKRRKRANAIGRILGDSDYDIVCLGESADEGQSNRVEEQFEKAMQPDRQTWEASTPPGAMLVSLVAGGDRRRVNVETGKYDDGKKGWQRIDVEIDVDGVDDAGIEVFLTHMQHKNKNLQRGWRRSQIKQMKNRIKDRRDARPGWPKILVGDLNVHSWNFHSYDEAGVPEWAEGDGDRWNDYDFLLWTMNKVNMQDAWLTHGGPAGGTKGTKIDPVPSPDPHCYGNNFERSHFDGNRLDYVFIEKPNTNHAIHLDIPRMWRVPLSKNCPWTRDQVDDDLFKYPSSKDVPPGEANSRLSDHIGVGFELLISPA